MPLIGMIINICLYFTCLEQVSDAIDESDQASELDSCWGNDNGAEVGTTCTPKCEIN